MTGGEDDELLARTYDEPVHDQLGLFPAKEPEWRLGRRTREAGLAGVERARRAIERAKEA